MKDELTLEEQVAGLYFSYACRALLGGNKGAYVMLQLYDQSPEHYRLTIEAAHEHLLRTHNELKETVEKRYRQLQVVVGDLDRERSN